MTLFNNLKVHELKERKIACDNNCQFHAIVDQCLQNGIIGYTHTKLRYLVVIWLHDNQYTKIDDVTVKDLFDIDVVKINSYNKVNIIWGDEISIFAISQILNVKIIIYSSLNSNVYEIKPIDGSYSYTFHIGYYNNMHYVSTIPCIESKSI